LVVLMPNDYGIIAFVVFVLIVGAILYAMRKPVGRLVLALGVGGIFTLIAYFILILTGVYDNVKGVLNPTPALNVFAVVVIVAGLGAGYYAVQRARVKT
jgi:hypothetical protein